MIFNFLLTVTSNSLAGTKHELVPIDQQVIKKLNNEFNKITLYKVPESFVDINIGMRNRLDFQHMIQRFDQERLQLAYKACQPIIEKNEIFYLTENNIKILFKILNLDLTDKDFVVKKFLSYKGLYIPNLNIIFLNSFSDDENLRFESLIHECLHAYQYQYRLPIDLITLEQNNVKNEEKLNFLAYYYEVEAHWLTQKVNVPAAWQDYVQNSEDFNIYNKYINTSDQNALFSNYQLKETDASKIPLLGFFIDVHNKLSSYWSTMPFAVFNNRLNKNNEKPYSLDFHKLFLKSLAHAQFSGRDTFLFDKNGRDQKIFFDLNENFYNYILKLKSNQNSQILRIDFSKILTTPLSAYNIQFEKELNIATANVINKIPNRNQINAASVLRKYSEQFNKKNSKDFENLQKMKDQKQTSILQQGGEGSSPEIELLPIDKVIPFIQFQPNVDFSPLITDEKNLKKTEEAPYDIVD